MEASRSAGAVDEDHITKIQYWCPDKENPDIGNHKKTKAHHQDKQYKDNHNKENPEKDNHNKKQVFMVLLLFSHFERLSGLP